MGKFKLFIVEIKFNRGTYNEIVVASLDNTIKNEVIDFVEKATISEKIDEHGSWDFSADFDNKGRGSSLNWDLYGIGKDYHSKKLLIIIQIRQYVRVKKNYYPRIRKSYFLIGQNEDKTTFAHAVESRVIHNAIKKGNDVIYAVQSWMFGSDYKKVIRQGDLALIPIRRPDGVRLNATDILIEDSHHLEAEEIYKKSDDIYYAKNPKLKHLPGTHPNVSAEGWNKVFVSRRTDFWSFAAPTID